jgi:hypothetical protein
MILYCSLEIITTVALLWDLWTTHEVGNLPLQLPGLTPVDFSQDKPQARMAETPNLQPL